MNREWCYVRQTSVELTRQKSFGVRAMVGVQSHVIIAIPGSKRHALLLFSRLENIYTVGFIRSAKIRFFFLAERENKVFAENKVY